MNNLLERAKEPSSYLGIGAVFQGVGECLNGDYGNGVPLIVLGLMGIFKAEKGAK
jgi:hypothetical protein